LYKVLRNILLGCVIQQRYRSLTYKWPAGCHSCYYYATRAQCGTLLNSVTHCCSKFFPYAMTSFWVSATSITTTTITTTQLLQLLLLLLQLWYTPSFLANLRLF